MIASIPRLLAGFVHVTLGELRPIAKENDILLRHKFHGFPLTLHMINVKEEYEFSSFL